MDKGVVQFSCSVTSDSWQPCGVAHQASLSITNSWSLLKLMSIESVMPSNHLILCRPLLLLLQEWAVNRRMLERGLGASLKQQFSVLEPVFPPC